MNAKKDFVSFFVRNILLCIRMRRH